MSTRTQVASVDSGHRFFALNAKYYIDQKGSPSAMADDASELIEHVRATIGLVARSLSSTDESVQQEDCKRAASCLWGALHQLEMIQNLVNTMEVAE